MHTAEDWDRAYGAAELTMAIEAHPHVEQELGALPPGRGLELGCGEGRQAIWLARRGWRMTAVDFSGVAVARGRQLAAQHGVEVDWRVTDVLDWQPAAVDLVMVLYLHIPPDALAGVLGRAAATLAPGGTLFVLGWDRSNVADGTGGPRPAELLYDTDELTEAATGLRVEHAARVRQAGSDRAVDALLRATRPERIR